MIQVLEFIFRDFLTWLGFWFLLVTVTINLKLFRFKKIIKYFKKDDITKLD